MSDHPIIKVVLCPRGHAGGAAWGGGYRCSHKSCGKDRYEAKLAAGSLSKPIQSTQAPADLDYLKRKSLAMVPEAPMNDEQSVEWSKGKLARLLPEAVSVLAWDLRYGTEKVRTEAANKIMAANGVDKREASQGREQPTIVVNIGTGDSKAPWLERLKKPENK